MKRRLRKRRPQRSGQLQLDGFITTDWKLSDSTKELGLRGVAKAREILQEARKREDRRSSP